MALEPIGRLPYLGAIVIDAATGRSLFEDQADERGYPASLTKLMTFGVVMDQVAAGRLDLNDPVTVSAAAARTGGSQVHLKQGEVFTVDDLLYMLMIQSANDAAMALATHVAGSRDAFVGLMNEKARALGLTHTVFHSPHGLPPGAGQEPDVSTPRDLARLSRELISQGQILRYSAVRERTIREQTTQPFIMRTHNGLLGALPGCDGLKTGYFSAAGYSISVTAERAGRRLITLVLGSTQRVARDVKAKELTELGFADLAAEGGTNSAGGAEQSSTTAEPMFRLNFTIPKKSP